MPKTFYAKSSTQTLRTFMSKIGIAQIRQRIEAVREPYQTGLKFQYLTGARVSEVCGKWAFNMDEYEVTDFDDVPLIVCTLRTAKRKGKRRPIAIPLEPMFEPWGRDIADYIEEADLFEPFYWSTWTQWKYARKTFEGLTYAIEEYYRPEFKSIIQEHSRELRTHGLRHIRATQLVNLYRFSPVQLATYMGWKLSGHLGGSRMMDRYVALQWHDYFPKLLKRRE